jgi:hypothetical protein
VRFPCERCDYRATILGDLKKHVLSRHEGVRYPCTECDYQGTTVHNLTKVCMGKIVFSLAVAVFIKWFCPGSDAEPDPAFMYCMSPVLLFPANAKFSVVDPE